MSNVCNPVVGYAANYLAGSSLEAAYWLGASGSCSSTDVDQGLVRAIGSGSHVREAHIISPAQIWFDDSWVYTHYDL